MDGMDCRGLLWRDVRLETGLDGLRAEIMGLILLAS